MFSMQDKAVGRQTDYAATIMNNYLGTGPMMMTSYDVKLAASARPKGTAPSDQIEPR